MTTSEVGSPLRIASPQIIGEYAQRIAQSPEAGRIMLLAARPIWNGPPSIAAQGITVWVRTAVSQLAALEAVTDLLAGDLLIILTDVPEEELGDAVTIPSRGQRVNFLDEWSTIPELFSAVSYDPQLREYGNWLPQSLIAHRPPGGWPKAPSGIVTADLAMSGLLTSALGMSVNDSIDEAHLLVALDVPEIRTRWAGASPELRTALITWVGRSFGEAARLALAASSASKISVLAFGVGLDVLWPDSSDARTPATEQIAARTRAERYFGSAPISPREARALASASRQTLLRMSLAGDSLVPAVMQQAETWLADIGWAEGASRSDLLPAGFAARAGQLAEALMGVDLASVDLPRIEGVLNDLLDHQLAAGPSGEAAAARMVVRLVRWLASEESAPQSLSDCVSLHMADGSWVDRAAATVWTGSNFESNAAAYARVLKMVQVRRTLRDRQFAKKISEELAGPPVDTVPGTEDILPHVVRPLTSVAGCLLIVLDGMSAATANSIVEDVVNSGWQELVEDLEGSGHSRRGVLSAIPSLTTFSRTSLFAGHLAAGQQADEKRSFGAPLFHKDDLRAPAGARLPGDLVAGLNDPRKPLLGVVLNTIDDALAKHDPGGTIWTLNNIQHLADLLQAAALAGRTLILTSDHGHVVERGSEHRPVAGAAGRWRPTSSGPAAPDEVELSGRRVLAPGGSAVVPVVENLRYSQKQAGYHGGCTLAEMIVPVIVLNRAGALAPKRWRVAPPQTPGWWNDPVRVQPADNVQTRPRATRKAKSTEPRQEQPLFQFGPEPVTEPAAAVAVSWVPELMQSRMYQDQRTRAGRRALSDSRVDELLTVLAQHGGRVHRDSLARAGGVSVAELTSELAALRRLLNVEGYQVLTQDSDGVTVVLDIGLLTEQFSLGAVR
ncbi:BREX-2 system phosphatase PglZ [Arthrobacter sp. B2I5]|uniref:BREX-2 system phosphatase PglZ n=1 Tax=Arthrobacter sp. B2I5 TaxID=3042266 RepID=UPI0027D8DF4E|nr:BREX-2 system phosphatase PglZ [Arthrobacter sp. B2I5]